VAGALIVIAFAFLARSLLVRFYEVRFYYEVRLS